MQKRWRSPPSKNEHLNNLPVGVSIVDELIKLVLKHQGSSTDYRTTIKGVKILPLSVEIEVTHLPTGDNAALIVS